MSDEQTSETTANAVVSGAAASTRTLDVNKPHLWRIFKRDEKADSVFIGPVWCEIGAAAAETSYWFGEIQTLGALGGAGEYMLIHDGRVTFMRIAQTEPRFEEVEEGE